MKCTLWFRGVFPAALLLIPTLVSAADPTSFRSDPEGARTMLAAISRHQVRALKAGDYTRVDSVAAAAAARKPEGVDWRYPWGVTLYGLSRASDVLKDPALASFVAEHNRLAAEYYAWLAATEQRVGDNEGWDAFTKSDKTVSISRLVRLGNLDACGAMGAQMLESLLRSPANMTPEQKIVVERVADWILRKQERLSDGTFWRPKSSDQSKAWKPGTIWIDDLYMSTPFMVRYARLTGDAKILHDAASQIIHMAERVQDSDGVWFHAYNVIENKKSPFKWGRANGWAMVSTVEVLSELPEDHPDRPRVLEILRKHIAGVTALQPASGVWHQVLDKPELWEESSCTAMFVYSIARAVKRGWIPAEQAKVAWKGFAGLKKFVSADGAVAGTCEGTNIGLELDYYANRKRPDDDIHAPGPVLLAAAELARLP